MLTTYIRRLEVSVRDALRVQKEQAACHLVREEPCVVDVDLETPRRTLQACAIGRVHTRVHAYALEVRAVHVRTHACMHACMHTIAQDRQGRDNRAMIVLMVRIKSAGVCRTCFTTWLRFKG